MSENSRRCSDLKPASRSLSAASSAGSPWTSGTAASPGPLETVIVTSDPSSASVPGSGRWPATRSSGTVSDWIGTTSTSKPRFWRICAAVPERLPTTSGTLFCSGDSSSQAPIASAASASTTSAISAIRPQFLRSSSSSTCTGSSATATVST